MSQVLVTGATGFVGSFAARALVDAGHDVRVLARRPDRVTVGAAVPGDVTDPASVAAAVAGCEAVVHAAGLVALDDRRAAEAHRVNVDGTRIVLDAALAAGARIVVHVSTVSVFGTGRRRTIRPDTPLADARGGYARSKLAAERAVRELQDRGAPVVTVYPGGVLGPDAPTVTPTHRGLAIWVAAPPRTTSGTSIVDVRDLAALIARVAEQAQGPGRWLAGGHSLPWSDLAAAIARVTGRRAWRVPMPGPALRAAGRLGDVAGRFRAFDFPLTLEAMRSATDASPVDSSATEAAFGPCWRPVEATLADSIRWLVEAGALPPRPAGRAAPGG